MSEEESQFDGFKIHSMIDPETEEKFYVQVPDGEPPLTKKVELPSTGEEYTLEYSESEQEDVEFEVEFIDLEEEDSND